MEDKDDISIKLEKQTLIREEIINKGYDSIQFIEYLIQFKGPGGENINTWSVQDLKYAIKDFIELNKGKSNNGNNIQNVQEMQKPLSNKPNENDSKLDMPAPLAPQEKNLGESVLMNIIDIKNNLFSDSSKKLDKVNYGLETPDSLDCRPIDQTNLSLHQEIYVKIGFPEKIDGGFFGRDSVLFTLTAIPLGFIVKRNYFDFEWLHNILIKLYSSNFIPSLPPLSSYQNRSNQDSYFKECIRNLDKFMNYLLTDPIIKNSQILYDFLCVESEKEFKNRQKDYENSTPSNDVQNFQSINGKIDINITQEAEKNFSTLKTFCNESEKLYKQLYYNLYSIQDNFNSLIKRLNEASSIWDKLFKLNGKYFNNDNIQNEIIFQFKNMFQSLEKAIIQQNDFMKIDVKENFNFLYNNLGNFEQVIKKVDEYKRIYIKEEKDLISLKNDLFTKKQGGSAINKEVDLSKLLPKNTEATLEMKKNYGYYLNRSIIEFKRMRDLDNELFKTNIIKCFKAQCDIVKTLQSEINDISSKINELRSKSEIKNEIREKKDENKDKDKNSEENINKINVN